MSSPPPPPPVDLKPRYCEQCGTPMVSKPKQYGFNTYTGEPKIIDFRRCPNARWWDGLFGRYHTK